MAEEARVSVRNVRRHSKDDMEALEGEVSTDEVRRGEARLQELTDSHIAKIDQLVQRKETELLEV
jgi:ribosome recycling factor